MKQCEHVENGVKIVNLKQRANARSTSAADYHPFYTSGIFSAVSMQCGIFKISFHICPIIYVSIFATESARLVFLHCTSHRLPVNQTVWALMCHVFVTDFVLLKFEFPFSLRFLFYCLSFLTANSRGATLNKKFCSFAVKCPWKSCC